MQDQSDTESTALPESEFSSTSICPPNGEPPRKPKMPKRTKHSQKTRHEQASKMRVESIEDEESIETIAAEVKKEQVMIKRRRLGRAIASSVIKEA